MDTDTLNVAFLHLLLYWKTRAGAWQSLYNLVDEERLMWRDIASELMRVKTKCSNPHSQDSAASPEALSARPANSCPRPAGR